MFTAVGFDTFRGQFINPFIGLAVNGWRSLQELLFLGTGRQKITVGYEFGRYRIEIAIVFKDFLFIEGGTSHI